MIGYPLTQLYEEVAFIAYHFHWSQAELMDLEHRTRRQWVTEISKINQADRSQSKETNLFLS